MAQVKCPKCSRPFVRRVSIVGSAETLLGIFYVYPFKCQICGVRFHMPQWGVRYLRVPEDKREYDRLPTSFSLNFQANNMTGQGAALNVSMGGCNFNSTMRLASGTVLQMGLQVADGVDPIVVDAAVVRYTHERSIGVEFLQWQESERERLQQFVRGLLISHPE
jgi:hypothetical protein